MEGATAVETIQEQVGVPTRNEQDGGAGESGLDVGQGDRAGQIEEFDGGKVLESGVGVLQVGGVECLPGGGEVEDDGIGLD